MSNDINRTSYTVEEFAKAIERARKAAGLTQAELGSRLRLSQGYVSNIENGKVNLRLSSLMAIARVLGLDLILVPRQVLPAIQALISGQPGMEEDDNDSEVDHYLYRLKSMDQADG